MQNKPFISIIIPVYNVEKYITRALESCINQTFSDIEILVVDDCGNDNSINIAKDYALKDSRIQIIHNIKNLGTFNTRLEGIKKAKGLYLLFLDSDDYITLNACEVLANKILSYYPKNNKLKDLIDNEIDSNLPDVIFFGMRFYPMTFKRVAPPVLTQTLYNEEILKTAFVHCPTPPWHIWAKLYKASHITRTINLLMAHMGDFPRLNMAEDSLKSFAIMALANKTIGIKDKLYVYCNNENSITRRRDLDSTKKKINDFDSVINYLDKFSKIREIRENPNYHISKIKIQNILRAQKELEYRYLNPDELKTLNGGGYRCYLTPYLNATLNSLHYHKKWQTYVRIITYILTLSKIKL